MPARFLDPYSSSAYTAPGLNMRGNGGKCVYLYFFLKSATGSGRRLEVPVFTFCQARSRRRFLIYFIFILYGFDGGPSNNFVSANVKACFCCNY